MNLRALFTENLKIKALSLLFAAVLWLFVTLKSRGEAEIPLQLNFRNVPQGLTLKDPVSARLTLHIAGPRLLLMKQRSRSVVIPLDLSGLSVGKVRFSSLERYITLPGGLTPLRVFPGTVEIELIPALPAEEIK